MSQNRFVVLRHEVPAIADRPSHFDLMFEHGNRLITWSIAEWPLVSGEADAMKLPDHRLHYLEYEGAISGGRGTLYRIEAGICELLNSGPNLYAWRIKGVDTFGELTFVEQDPKIHRWSVCWSSPKTLD